MAGPDEASRQVAELMTDQILDRLPNGPMTHFNGQPLKRDRRPTIPHPYAYDPIAPQFSQQEYAFSKHTCSSKARLPHGAVRTKIVQGNPCTNPRRNASSDKQREALLAWQKAKHNSACCATAKGILKPGDVDDGDSIADPKREDRAPHVPHWSFRQFNLKKNMQMVPIHQTDKNASRYELQSTNFYSYPHPKNQENRRAEIKEETENHSHQSWMAMNLAKRRHVMDISGFCEASYRSAHPPLPCPDGQYFCGPEPDAMCSNLYPHGPSVVARHYPDIYHNHIIKDDAASGSKSGSQRGSGDKKQRPTSAPFSSRRRSSPPHGMVAMDGSAAYPIPDFTEGTTAKARTPRQAACDPHCVGYRGKPWKRPEMPQPKDPYGTYMFNKGVGKPPPATERSRDSGHVYRSHCEMEYDKALCVAEAYRHSDHWERIEQGSGGHHTPGGSCWDSECDRSHRSGAITDRGRGSKENRPQRSARSADPRGRRPKSADPTSRSKPRTARAASADRSRGERRR